MASDFDALRLAGLLEHEASAHGPTDYKHKAAAMLRNLATQPPASNAGEGEDLHDFTTHRAAWRKAIEHLAAQDDSGYWPHELKAFDKAMAEFDRAALATKPQAWDVAQDSARLDWLESNATEKLLNPSGFHCEFIPDNRLRYEFPTLVSYDAIGQQISLRDAIDAARTRGEGGGT